MTGIQTVVVADEDGEVRLDRFLRRRFPHLTQGQIEKLARTGQVRVDGARAKASDRLTPGQSVRIPPLPPATPRAPTVAPAISAKDAAFVQSLVLHRDADMIVLNKLCGLATQGGAKTLRHIDGLLPGLSFERDDRPKLVHRLDRDTSGVLVLARHPQAAAFLAEAFRSRDTTKVYWAVVRGRPSPEAGEIRGFMKKTTGAHDADRERMRRAAHGEEGAQFAITDYTVVSAAADHAAWVALKPVTGRTHQLRFHMAEISCGILGDRKYDAGPPAPSGLPDKLHLHARAIEIPHPSGGALRIVAPLPDHMRETFAALGFDERDAKNPFAVFS